MKRKQQKAKFCVGQVVFEKKWTKTYWKIRRIQKVEGSWWYSPLKVGYDAWHTESILRPLTAHERGGRR